MRELCFGFVVLLNGSACSRAQFARANEKDLASEAKQEESGQDVENCVLCHEATNSSENPLCAMLLLQRFRVVEECSLDEDGKVTLVVFCGSKSLTFDAGS